MLRPRPKRSRAVKESKPRAATVDIEPAHRRRPPPIPQPPEPRAVAVHGSYAENAVAIPRTIASLHLLPAVLEPDADGEHDKILMPFAEVRLGGGSLRAGVDTDEEPPTLFTANMPIENLAYILLDLTADLKRMCREVCEMGQGPLAVDAVRMAHVRYFVAHLERQARLCRLRLDAFYGAPDIPDSPTPEE